MQPQHDMSAYCGTEKIDYNARAAYNSLNNNDFDNAEIYLKDLVKEIEVTLEATKELQNLK